MRTPLVLGIALVAQLASGAAVARDLVLPRQLRLPHPVTAREPDGLALARLNRCAVPQYTVLVSFDSRYDDRVCESFVADITGQVGVAVCGLSMYGYPNTTTPTVVAEIYTDDGMGFPGVFLGSSEPVTVTVSGPGIGPTPARLPFVNGPALVAGTAYVVVFRPVEGLCLFATGGDETACPDGKGGRWAPLYYTGWGDLGLDVAGSLFAR